ncbi:MAG: sigma-70 family RNA polymerase sigma factor [Gaiellaceae bacterium]
MDEHDVLAEQFEAERGRLRAVAYRMLGSAGEADDALQESWLRLGRAGTSGVENLGGWMTTVVARVCLDMLRSRKSRREEPLAEDLPGADDPEHEALLADSVGLALLVVLETLTPAERVAFVLHDMFAVPFDEIAAIVGRSPAAARQLASRARRRVQDAAPGAAPTPNRRLVDAFLAAPRGGDFDALLALLDPDAVLEADAAAVQMGADREVRGASSVARVFSGRALAAQAALVDGSAGIVWAPAGRPRVVWTVAVANDRIVRIEMIAAAERLGELELVVLTD